MKRQPTLSTRAPPSTGPPTSPIEEIPPQAASAPRRAGPAAKVWMISASEQGIKSAAPSPCAERAAISAPIDGAAAQAALPRPKTPSPTRKARREPIRSAQAPALSRKVAKASV
jgi:hypothetical protein